MDQSLNHSNMKLEMRNFPFLDVASKFIMILYRMKLGFNSPNKDSTTDVVAESRTVSIWKRLSKLRVLTTSYTNSSIIDSRNSDPLPISHPEIEPNERHIGLSFNLRSRCHYIRADLEVSVAAKCHKLVPGRCPQWVIDSSIPSTV